MTKRQKWFATVVLLLVPSLVLAGAISVEVGGYQYVKGLVLTAPSGSNAIGVAVNGARIDVGTGANDHMSSDGTTVTFAGATTLTGVTVAGTATVNTGFSMAIDGNSYLVNNTATSALTVRDEEGLGIFGVATGSLATCNNTAPPAGTRGTWQYDTTTSTMKYCNGTSWQAITPDTVPATGACTNQFVRGVNGISAPTCATVSLTADVTGTLPVANGGTNSTATPTAGGAGYGTGTAHAYTGAGTTGQCLKSAGAGAPTWGTCYGDDKATGEAVVDVASTTSGTCAADFGVTTTGAALAAGAVCTVGFALSGVGGVAGMQYTAWPSDTGSVTVRPCCNGSATCDPANQTYYVICLIK